MRLQWLLAIVFVVLGVSAARADTLYFTYTGLSNAGISDTLTFTLPSTPGPFLSGGQTIFNTVSGSPGSFDGFGLTGAFLSFSTAGGFFLDGSYGSGTPDYTHLTVSLSGPQLFSVNNGAPLFTPDTFNLSGTVNLQALAPGMTSSSHDTAGTLTISTAPAPEPASFLLLGTGLAGVARAVKRRWA